jgi:hypothetical protein
MRRAVLVLALALLVASCGDAKKPAAVVSRRLDAAAFTKRYVESVQAANPGSEVTRTGSLRVTVRLAGQEPMRVFLDNAFGEYETAPDRLDEILANYGSLSRLVLPSPSGEVDLDRVVPLVRIREYVEFSDAEIRASGKPDSMRVAQEPLAGTLVLLYGEDSERTISVLSRESVSKLGLDGGALRKRAVANLKRICAEFGTESPAPGVHVVSADGSYEASFLLVDDLWTKEHLVVRGDYVVGVPSRGTLLVTGSDDRDGIAYVRQRSQAIFDSGDHALTPQLFVRREGRWQVFP